MNNYVITTVAITHVSKYLIVNAIVEVFIPFCVPAAHHLSNLTQTNEVSAVWGREISREKGVSSTRHK